MRLSAIVAYDNEMAIGKDGRLPWHLPRDLARFKALTMGKPVIMGRRTHESIGRLLPGRANIVLTHDPSRVVASGALLASSLDEAISIAESAGVEEVMVIGGEAVYRALLPRCQRVYATEVAAFTNGDVWFPSLGKDEWRVVEEEHFPADEDNPLSYRYRVYERTRNSIEAS